MLTISDGENDIVDKLKEISNVDVMSGDYLLDSFVPKADSKGLFRPYIIVKFSGTYSTWDNGICGADKDTLRNTATIYCVTPTDNESRKLRDIVRQKLLVGFVPRDSSALRQVSGYSFTDADLGYHRYIQANLYQYTTNLGSL